MWMWTKLIEVTSMTLPFLKLRLKSYVSLSQTIATNKISEPSLGFFFTQIQLSSKSNAKLTRLPFNRKADPLFVPPLGPPTQIRSYRFTIPM